MIFVLKQHSGAYSSANVAAPTIGWLFYTMTFGALFAVLPDLLPASSRTTIVGLKRHDEIWPDLVDLLKDAGISDYSIHLDDETNLLFGVLWRTAENKMDALPAHDVMQKWWLHMSDIMESQSTGEPVVASLEALFHLNEDVATIADYCFDAPWAAFETSAHFSQVSIRL